MSNSNPIQTSQQAMQVVGVIESTEFSTIFGSNVNPKWSETLMKYSGHYLFSAALILNAIKLGLAIYQFAKSANKSLNKDASFGWTLAQTAVMSTAIFGGLIAASAFVLVTPILFVTTMAIDTLRNIGLMFWNIGQLAALRFSLRKELKDPENHLTKIRYEKLKEKYLADIKGHGIAALIGTVMTSAASILFLFPQIGLGAVGAASIALIGVKISVAQIAGFAAACALGIPTIPSVIQFAKWSMKKINQVIRRKAAKENNEELILQNPVVEKLPIEQLSTKKIHVTFNITTDKELETAMNYTLNFNAFSKKSNDREIIIESIQDQNLAKKALLQMIDKKMLALRTELQNAKNTDSYFQKQQGSKREQKLLALALIKNFLDGNANSQTSAMDFEIIKYNEEISKKFDSASDLISYLEKNLPKVQQSFFLEQSDTQNIIEALKVYAGKFPVTAPSARL